MQIDTTEIKIRPMPLAERQVEVMEQMVIQLERLAFAVEALVAQNHTRK